MIKTQTTIIIVTFNSEKYILKCLDKTMKNIPESWKLVLVDNCSGDNTYEAIKSKYGKNQKIKIIKTSHNQGFARAVNFGIRESEKSSYYLLLNPDVVPNKSSFKPLLKYCVTLNAGICGGSTYNEHKEENGSYFRLPNLLVGIFDFTNFRKFDLADRWHKYFYYKNDSKDNKHVNVDVVTGGYMLIRSDTIHKIGYLDERFFMYLEDVDFCKRAKDSRIRIVHCHDSNVLHYSGKSSFNRDRIRHTAWIMSRKKYFLKHFGFLENVIIQPIFLLDDVYILLSKLLKR